VKSLRTGSGMGPVSGSGVSVQVPVQVPFPVSAPPLPADTQQNRRRSQLNSEDGDDISRTQGVSAGSSRGGSRGASRGASRGDSRGLHDNDIDGIDGEDIDDDDTQLAIDREQEGVPRDGGYLKQHMQYKKDSSTLQRRHSTNSKQTLGDDEDQEQEQEQEQEQDSGTVRSRASSFSVRSTGSKGRASSTGRASSMVPFGGRSKALSNIQQVKNAINLVCLAGGHFDVQRAEAVRAIELCSTVDGDMSVTQVLVLVSNSKSLSFKALYAVHPIDGTYVRSSGHLYNV
jgi:Microtubule-binding calmodulin-regulated spectrin-associated